jgi:type I restriction enzyme S subunit
LNSWVGQQQFRRLENGAVQLNINIEELSSIAIWKASQEFQNEIQQLLFVQISAVNLSKLLANTAKTLVEALIEGHLTEQQLIQAQQALEDGDNSLDQAILSKLSAEGYAIEGAIPLFSDVDELYRLLEDAAQDEAEVKMVISGMDSSTTRQNNNTLNSEAALNLCLQLWLQGGLIADKAALLLAAVPA